MTLFVGNDAWHFPERFRMTGDEFFEFASQMECNRVEMDKHGNIVILPLVGLETGILEANASYHLKMWALENGGSVFSCSTGFTLPNNAVRSPDAAWISDDNYSKIPKSERKKFARICPDFIIEVRSSSDNLKPIQEKMEEYIENGSLLGFLIDPEQQKAWIFRPNMEPELVEDFSSNLSGEAVLPGFELPLTEFIVE